MRLTHLLAFMLLSHLLAAQTAIISGKVIDSRSGDALELVNVYVNRTSIGMTTLGDGGFKLSVPPGNVELLCSRVGYKTEKVVFSIAPREVRELTIRLVMEQTALQEVVVTAKNDKAWEKQFNQFTKVFLGKDEIAAKCVITNKHVLDFAPSNERGGFVAVASAPLDIINPLLGYKIRYELVNFKYTPASYLIAGNIRFENLESDDPATLKLWSANRQRAYRNSIRSFLKSVIDNRLKEDGYEAFVEKTFEPQLGRTSLFYYFKPYLDSFDRSKHLKDSTNSTYVLRLPTRLELHDTRSNLGIAYRDVTYQVSWAELSQPLHISAAGVVYNPGAIQLIGHLSSFRVAHSLPENYEPDVTANDHQPQVTTSSAEQIYVHTDKDYYYPGEPIWLKGYMHYSRPELADSMSRVVYVELIDSTRKVLARKSFPVEYGTFDGKLMVPSTIRKATVGLRAYTQWMRNFGSTHFFIKPLPVLDTYERVIGESLPQSDTTEYSLRVETAKDSYAYGDSIMLDLKVTDDAGNMMPADMSVSVVNYDIVKYVSDRTPIDQAFKILPRQKSTEIEIERGISVSGKISDSGRKIQSPVSVTAVLGKMDDMATIETRNDGTFTLTGFHFYDSSTISFQALNKKKNSFGKFTIVTPSYPEVDTFLQSAAFPIKRAYTAVRKSYSELEDGGVLLKEVTVTAKREKPYKDMYTSGNISLSGERIRELNPADLMSIFMGRIPRVRLRYFMNELGLLKQFLFIPGLGVPLVVIDGVPFEGEIGMDMIKTINVNQVERIEVMADASSASIYGSRGANGVVIILTRAQYGNGSAGNPDEFSGRDFSTFPVYGFSSFKPFAQSVAEEVDVTTVYWNPYALSNADIAAQVKFKANVRASAYLVTVKGFTRDGNPVSATRLIHIKE